MLTRRLFRLHTSPTSQFLRSFSSSPISRDGPGRSPGLGDITPNGADQFNTRQQEFRDNLEAARKQKEQQDSQSIAADPSPSSSTAQDDHPNPQFSVLDAANRLDPAALGSLSTHRGVGEARKADTDGSTKRGPLSSLIYGTHEGQNMDKEMERSFSQVLARGKYVHSIVFHEVKPDKVDEYVQLVGEWYPKMAGLPENKVNLVGSWRTEVGDCDTFGLHLRPMLFTGLANLRQSTSGSIKDTQGITRHSTTYPTIPDFLNSTGI
ncbi:MAG: hypothetical protein Q9227_001176 [Pyrenula ochraceoflavens]